MQFLVVLCYTYLRNIYTCSQKKGNKMKYITILLVFVTSMFGNNVDQDYDFGNGFKLVNIHTDHASRIVVCSYTADLPTAEPNMFAEAWRAAILSYFKVFSELNPQAFAHFNNMLQKGFVYVYNCKSSSTNPDKPWEVEFEITASDLGV